MLLALTMASSLSMNNVDDATYTRVTCYTWTGNKTASGVYPEEGMVAGKREDIGKICLIYDKDKNYIGAFLIADTGGQSIRQGKNIDVYRDSLDRCYEWINTYGDYCYIKIIERGQYEMEKKKERLEKWLDKQIEIADMQEEANRFDDDILMCSSIYGFIVHNKAYTKALHVFNSVRNIAEILGCEMYKSECGDGDFYLYVLYKGVAFHQLIESKKEN